MFNFSKKVSLTVFLLVALVVSGAGYLYFYSGSKIELEPVNRSSLGFITPENFVSGVDHPLYTLTPGSVWTYKSTEEDEDESVAFEVLETTKTISGVEATVVVDTDYEDGVRVESNEALLAQDIEGNVWILGETNKEFEDDGTVTVTDHWVTGESGAIAGIVMKAEPKLGDTYLNEFQPDQAETAVGVVSLDAEITVPYGTFTDCLQVREWSPQDDVAEYKYYCPEVGWLVYEEQLDEEVDFVLVNIK